MCCGLFDYLEIDFFYKENFVHLINFHFDN